ncbi:hypothetical protein [Streptomyces montanisoli]|uniref:Uncharacterized protein n=1 Tax=Streptomyces montanisoli TaxID=2798581 RepID=A0A940M8L4_9ACTN|nr:hypothetical protein [Streptomyces montanisoli]MBP0458265.1 hypothetical protein [Streptomyces montanisoli]
MSGKGGAATMSHSQVVADELPLRTASGSGLFKQGLDVTLTSLSGSDCFPC